jgi:hypothetical protein
MRKSLETLTILTLTALTALSCKSSSTQLSTPSGALSPDSLNASQNGNPKAHPGHHPRPGTPPSAPSNPSGSTTVGSSGTPPPPDHTSPNTANDACANLPSPGTQYHCGYDRCDQVERVRIACDLKDAVQDHYSGFYLKNQRLSHFDSESHLNDCVKLEASTTDNDEVAFTDRMKACVAGFQDTHFRLETVRALPMIQAPILVTRVQGHYYITGMISRLLTGALAQLTYGTEILAVDGQDISTAAAALVSYIPASSREYADDMAARALFMRQFAYPTKSSVKIKAKLTSGQAGEKTIEAELPWTYLTSADRLDTHALFVKAKISPTNNSTLFNSWQEYSSAIPVFAKTASGSDLDVYARGAAGSDPSAALRTGIVSIQGQQVGYLQILTFNSPTVYGGTRADQSIAWLDAVRGFVKSVKAAGLNLVIDLRWNDGGDPALADQLLGILAETGKAYGGGAMAYRTTDSEKGLLWGEGSSDLPASMTTYFTTSELARIFSDASQAKAQETPILVNGDIQADPQVGGYSGQITALISDQCISACDRMAALLDRSGRATLLGTPSNGTGLGYASESLFYGWSDWHGLLSVKIPAHIFGVAPKALGTNAQDHILPFDSNADAYLTENRPTSPKKSFEPSIQDIMLQGTGWASAIQKTLPAAPQPSP